MSIVKVKKFAQVTIPTSIRQKAHIEEGDYVEISYDNNRIVIIPKRVTDKSIDWDKKFEKAIADVRETAKKTGIAEKDVETAVKSVRKRGRR
jgi:AbrB family looped-hinge helix DNA binding protein